MILKNINQTLREPSGYYFDSVRTDGAFLVVAYSQKLLRTGTNIPLGTRWIHIWVNDQGREVIRTEDNWVPAPVPPPVSVPAPPPPKTFWQELKEDMRLIFTGFWRIQ